MGKRGRNQRKDKISSKRRSRNESEDFDDEIDAFHKERDIIPLNANEDLEDSDEDDHPVFDLEGVDNDEDDEDEDEDEDDDNEASGFTAKLKRQQKYLRAKFGGVEDEMHDGDDDYNDNEENAVWGVTKSTRYGGDNEDFELKSSDDESLVEEEAEVLRMQREKAKSLSVEDFGLGDTSEDDSERELTLEEISAKGNDTKKPLSAVDDFSQTFEEVKKDLNALSKEEQMDVVYSSAPELVGLLSELNDAVEELENKVNPLLTKMKEGEICLEGGLRYMAVKQLLLMAYCQAISVYLLLKSEGHPVRDHPVLGRIVEIQGLLDKMKLLDENLPSELEGILTKYHGAERKSTFIKEMAAVVSNSITKDKHQSIAASDAQGAELGVQGATDLAKLGAAGEHDNVGGKSKHQSNQVGRQSREMLKVRAALEEKWKTGLVGSITSKPDKAKKQVKPVNGKLETYDDFDDDAVDVENGARGLSNRDASSIPQLVTAKQKPKIVSGDDDLPKRDDIGERRRKHELRVLAKAGIIPDDEPGNEIGMIQENGNASEEDEDDTEDSEDEYYKKVKEERATKLAAKAEMYTRTSAPPSLPETVDGKRQITTQMEKNRGLTRARKKLTKNPRKKYRVKHDISVKRRKGQVREIRKPTGQYGGEASGINVRISRSIRL